MNYEDLANLTKINKTEIIKVLEIAKSMEISFQGPAILYSKNHNRAITGSHRIEAAKILIEKDDENAEIECEMIDVDEYLENYCEKNDCTIDNIDCSALSIVFAGTDIENEVMKNIEW